jgi:RNA polymerase sigma factor (sigma-70 family)
MTERRNGSIQHVLQGLLRVVDVAEDNELLARFRSRRDGEAFALLVRRHGPMVLSVCQRVLRGHADAEDAFQATFLVLARRAGVVRPGSCLANWLYGVAYRTAMEARRAAAVRRVKEQKAAEMKPTSVDPIDVSPELSEVLDRELAALPDLYRSAVVLCDLEGLSRAQAAVRLGWSEGTLSGRLFRARSLLARRLQKYGLTLTSVGFSATVAGSVAASVPAALTETTVRMGVLVAAGEAVASVATAPVQILTEGVMKGLLLAKLKVMTTALIVGCAVLVTTTAGWRANSLGAADPPKATPTPQNPDKDRIAQLERERDLLLKENAILRARLELAEAQNAATQKNAAQDIAAEVLKLQLEREAEQQRRAREHIEHLAAEYARQTQAYGARLKKPTETSPVMPTPPPVTPTPPLVEPVKPSTSTTPKPGVSDSTSPPKVSDPTTPAPVKPALPPLPTKPVDPTAPAATVNPQSLVVPTKPASTSTPVVLDPLGFYQQAVKVQPAVSRAKAVVLVHPLDGLVANEKEAELLIKVVRATVEPKSWGVDAEVEYYPLAHSLVVRQSPTAQTEVEELLKLLRSKSGQAK